MLHVGGTDPGGNITTSSWYRWSGALFARQRRVHLLADALVWVLALIAAVLLRLDFDPDRVRMSGLIGMIIIVVASQVAIGGILGLYAGRWRSGSFDEVAAIARATAIQTVFLFVVNVTASHPRMVPITSIIGCGAIALVGIGGVRYLARALREARHRPSGEHLVRVVVFGAGDAAAQVTTAMLRDPNSTYLPVAVLDDDPTRQSLRIAGVPVVGSRADVEHAATKFDAEALLIAIPRAGRELVGDLSDRARAAGLAVKVLPSTRELLDGRVGVGDIRDVDVSDLLGRREIRTQLRSIAGYIKGRRVLVTGAGGSIGSELCRQIQRFSPNELIMLDRDESALHGVQLSIEQRALLDDPSLVLLDIRDVRTLRGLFEERRPEVVFHAAALKHQPLLERFPGEALRTNIAGTLSLLELAAEFGVSRFVNISTDKAADPISVLGSSKRIAERLTAFTARETGRAYLSVRFGNVLGSRGSVLETFQAQVAAGGPVTVTHPDVTRFFMTISEAVELVLQAGAIGNAGEVLVLDMGEPVRIADVARRLAALRDRDIEIEYTGLRPGEKLEEVLFGAGEQDRRPTHPLIAQVQAEPLAPASLSRLDDVANGDLASAMRALCEASDADEPSVR